MHNFNFEASFTFQENQENNDYMYVSGRALTFNTPINNLGTFIFSPSSFSKELESLKNENRTLPVPIAHNESQVAGGIPPNNITAREDGLHIKAAINKTYELGRQAAALIKQGVYRSFSIGGYFTDYDMDEDGETFFIKEARLSEISIVNRPADKTAVMDNIRFEDIQNIRDVERFLTSRGFSNRDAKTFMSKFKFLVRDDQKESGRDAAMVQVLQKLNAIRKV